MMVNTVTQNLLTTSTGTFTAQKPKAAHYRFVSTSDGECVDVLTKVKVTFPVMVDLPAANITTITPISLLTVPASEDDTTENGTGSNSLVHEHLWADVYKMFGYNASALQVGRRSWLLASILTVLKMSHQSFCIALLYSLLLVMLRRMVLVLSA
eukprot:GHUV01049989.1.p1 GENE.GHUV01049989.1~~GHUV01049989.1.p1  ORF type:complete len:154 (-),score=22.56 GHUV01049989.1:319-780(-)